MRALALLQKGGEAKERLGLLLLYFRGPSPLAPGCTAGGWRLHAGSLPRAGRRSDPFDKRVPDKLQRGFIYPREITYPTPPIFAKDSMDIFCKNKRLDYLLLSPGQAVPSASRKTLESPAGEPAATRKARPGLLETRNHFISRDHLSTWPPTTAASSGFWKHQLEFHRLCNLRFFLGCVRQFPLPTSRPTSPECLPFRLRFIFPTKTDFHRKLKQRRHLQTTKRKEKGKKREL